MKRILMAALAIGSCIAANAQFNPFEPANQSANENLLGGGPNWTNNGNVGPKTAAVKVEVYLQDFLSISPGSQYATATFQSIQEYGQGRVLREFVDPNSNPQQTNSQLTNNYNLEFNVTSNRKWKADIKGSPIVYAAGNGSAAAAALFSLDKLKWRMVSGTAPAGAQNVVTSWTDMTTSDAQMFNHANPTLDHQFAIKLAANPPLGAPGGKYTSTVTVTATHE